jgi:hypothetical protein
MVVTSIVQKVKGCSTAFKPSEASLRKSRRSRADWLREHFRTPYLPFSAGGTAK